MDPILGLSRFRPSLNLLLDPRIRFRDTLLEVNLGFPSDGVDPFVTEVPGKNPNRARHMFLITQPRRDIAASD